MRASVLLLLGVSAALAEYVNYEGYKVYSVYPQTKKQLDFLHALENNDSFDFWSDLRGNGVATDIMVPLNEQEYFEATLRSKGIEYESKIEDVEGLFREEREQLSLSPPEPRARLTFDKYHRHDVINNYLRELAKNFSNVVSLQPVGKSYEGRELIAIKISSGGAKNKSAILIDGGIHAREWIAPATVLYIIDQLVFNKTHSDLYKNVDWYILPVLNPDGYEYSHTKERLWRKTRSPGKQCVGVDANRNFDYYWGTIGASADECSGTYRGPKALSEIEARSIADFAKKHANATKLYLSFHSYGQLLLYPWGYKNESAPLGKELQALGESVRDAIRKVNGTTYKTGHSYHAIYPTSGSSVDYATGVVNIPLSYTVELPDRGYGFALPPQFIRGVVLETFEGVRVFGKHVENRKLWT